MRRSREEQDQGRNVRPRLDLRRQREEEDQGRNVRSRRNDALPRYETRHEDAQGFLHVVRLRPIFAGGPNADEEDTRRLIANSLRFQIRRLARPYLRGRRNNELDTLIRGTLLAESVDGPTRSLGENLRLGQINEDVIEDIFETITQSNENVQIYQIQWSFVIPRGMFYLTRCFSSRRKFGNKET